jgi:hypothetical protein
MPLVLGVAAMSLGGVARAQAPGLLDWSQTAARGVFDLCRADAPDAARVAAHGEVWGWPPFVGYLEHPEGYRREAGGESRRSYELGEASAYVEVTVQSGQVTSAAPADVRYFRCNVASDQPVDDDLKTYFTGLYGPPASSTAAGTVWLTGAAATAAAGGAGADAEAAALHAVAAAGPGAEGLRIELTREHGLDRAKLTLFRDAPAGSPGTGSPGTGSP